MWLLLNNSREFSVLKIACSSEKRNLFFKKKKHTEKGINYDISSTMFIVCFEIFVQASIGNK